MTGAGYPVGLRGERSYQAAIGRTRVGEPVRIVHEADNIHDDRALRVDNARGEPIGYLPRDGWLTRAILDERKPVSATIASIDGQPMGVVIHASLMGTAAPDGPGLSEGVRHSAAPVQSRDPGEMVMLLVIALLVALAVLLAIFGNTPRAVDIDEPAKSTSRPIETAGRAAANYPARQLAARPATERAAILGTIVTSAGERCRRAIRATRKGADRDLDFWAVDCGRDGKWLVSIAPDSATRVVSCTSPIGTDLKCDRPW